MSSEYIKTGKEISNQFDKDVRYIAKNRISLEHRANEKWVSLSWLKEQIQKKHKDFFHTKIKPTFYDGLDWFLSLLEQEEKKL